MTEDPQLNRARGRKRRGTGGSPGAVFGVRYADGREQCGTEARWASSSARRLEVTIASQAAPKGAVTRCLAAAVAMELNSSK